MPDWSDGSRTLAFMLRQSGAALYVAMNMYWEPLWFDVPPAPSGGAWHGAIDTAVEGAADPTASPLVDSSRILVGPRSVKVLEGH
jgi:isoamylase